MHLLLACRLQIGCRMNHKCWLQPLSLQPCNALKQRLCLQCLTNHMLRSAAMAEHTGCRPSPLLDKPLADSSSMLHPVYLATVLLSNAAFACREDILSLAHHPPGVIASGDYAGNIMFWSLHGGDRKLLLTHAGAPPDRAAVEAMAFLPLPGTKAPKVLLSCGGERSSSAAHHACPSCARVHDAASLSQLRYQLLGRPGQGWHGLPAPAWSPGSELGVEWCPCAAQLKQD